MRTMLHASLVLALAACGAAPAQHDGGFGAFVERGCYAVDSCERLVAEAEARFFRCGSHGVSCNRAKRDLDIAQLQQQRFLRVEQGQRCERRPTRMRRTIETELESSHASSEAKELTMLITRHIGECAATGARRPCDELRRFIQRWPRSPYRNEIARQLEIGDRRWAAGSAAPPPGTAVVPKSSAPSPPVDFAPGY